jgi:hypothetical protein
MIGRFLARGCFVAALSLTSFGCARADNAAEPSNAAAEMLPLPEILRGREITRVSPPAPPDALAQETFACDGRWAGQGRGGRSGVYWAGKMSVCVH